MVMAAAERVDITARVFHGDLVRFEGQLLYTGRSSVTVQVTGHRRGIHDRAFEQALSAVMTLVAVDENGRPATSGVPKLVDTDDSTFEERIEKWAGNRKALSARWAQAQAEIDALGLVPRDMLEYPSGGGVSVGESRVEFATGFMPNQLNANGTVYGGELLRWMVRGCERAHSAVVGNPPDITETHLVRLGQHGGILRAELHAQRERRDGESQPRLIHPASDHGGLRDAVGEHHPR
jgi:acyl-CoA hydrolase